MVVVLDLRTSRVVLAKTSSQWTRRTNNNNGKVEEQTV
jgi:hypothetical protein